MNVCAARIWLAAAALAVAAAIAGCSNIALASATAAEAGNATAALPLEVNALEANALVPSTPAPENSTTACERPVITIQSLLVAHSSVVVDPHYHVVFVLTSSAGLPCPETELQVGSPRKVTVMLTPTANEPVRNQKLGPDASPATLRTNLLGRASVYLLLGGSRRWGRRRLDWDGLAAPEIQVRTAAMPPNEWLLVFPDRPVLAALSELSGAATRYMASGGAMTNTTAVGGPAHVTVTEAAAVAAVDDAARVVREISTHFLTATPLLPAAQVFAEHNETLASVLAHPDSGFGEGPQRRRQRLRRRGIEVLGGFGKGVTRQDRAAVWHDQGERRLRDARQALFERIRGRQYDSGNQVVMGYLVQHEQPPKGFETADVSQNALGDDVYVEMVLADGDSVSLSNATGAGRQYLRTVRFSEGKREVAAAKRRRRLNRRDSTNDSPNESRMALQRTGQRLRVTLERGGRAVSDYIVRTVRGMLQVAGRVLAAVGVTFAQFFSSVAKSLGVDGIIRVQKLLRHLVLIRRAHIRESLAKIGATAFSRLLSDPQADVAALEAVGQQLGGQTVETLMKQGASVRMGGSSVPTNPREAAAGRGAERDERPLVKDVATAQAEDAMLAAAMASSTDAVAPEKKSDEAAEREANEIVDDILTELQQDKRAAEMLDRKQLLFARRENVLKTPYRRILQRIGRVYQVLHGVLASASRRVLASLARLNEFYYDALERPIWPGFPRLGVPAGRVSAVDMVTTLAAPSVYYQYLSLRGREPVSEADLATLLAVDDPMLLRSTWNADGASAEVVRERERVLDWVPRSFMATLTWTGVLWAHSAATLAHHAQGLDSETHGALQRVEFGLALALKWSRLLSGWKIGYLMGALSYPINDAADGRPETRAAALEDIYYRGWGMYAWWMFPVLWKTALPVVTLAKEQQLSRANAAGDKARARAIARTYAHAESLITGVPMAVAFSGVTADLWAATSRNNPKRMYTTTTSTLAWLFDGMSNFLSEAAFSGHVWPILYSMCTFYQARVTGMMLLDVTGLTDPSPAVPNVDSAEGAPGGSLADLPGGSLGDASVEEDSLGNAPEESLQDAQENAPEESVEDAQENPKAPEAQDGDAAALRRAAPTLKLYPAPSRADAVPNVYEVPVEHMDARMVIPNPFMQHGGA